MAANPQRQPCQRQHPSGYAAAHPAKPARELVPRRLTLPAVYSAAQSYYHRVHLSASKLPPTWPPCAHNIGTKLAAVAVLGPPSPTPPLPPSPAPATGTTSPPAMLHAPKCPSESALLCTPPPLPRSPGSNAPAQPHYHNTCVAHGLPCTAQVTSTTATNRRLSMGPQDQGKTTAPTSSSQATSCRALTPWRRPMPVPRAAGGAAAETSRPVRSCGSGGGKGLEQEASVRYGLSKGPCARSVHSICIGQNTCISGLASQVS